jgi:hypothetical protein
LPEVSNQPARNEKGSKRKRAALSDILMKLVNMLRQKDTYGFFISPVDVKVVPDYLRIISVPMDLGQV